MAVVPTHSEGPVPRSLADTLSQGPLPLAAALRFANDLAVELRDLHEQSRVYGKLTLHSISITESGARLVPLRSYWKQAGPERDIEAFGSVLYQMLHGYPPPSTLAAADIRIPASQTGPERLRATGTKLALRCISPSKSALNMQQVATELRLLTVLQRQEDANARPANESLASPTAPIEHELFRPSAAPDPQIAPPVVPLGPARFGAPRPKAPPKEAPGGGSCPKCSCAVVFVSRARSGTERFFERMKFPLVRCHRCDHRYVVIGRFKFAKEAPDDTERKYRPSKRRN